MPSRISVLCLGLLFPFAGADGQSPHFTVPAYAACVRQALDDYRAAGVITAGQRSRLLASALRAYHQER